MANYLSDRTGASIDTVLDNADAGNIGKGEMLTIATDLDTVLVNGTARASSATLNVPFSGDFDVVTSRSSALVATQTAYSWATAGAIRIFSRTNRGGWSPWQELYHTGNTGALGFSDTAPDGTGFGFFVRTNTGGANIENNVTTNKFALSFYNPNGSVGNISTNGTVTAYNTSSDPRLKDFAIAPTDSAINTEFNKVFSCFRTFNWKNDPQGALVWGFDAHACIDAGLDMGSEGEGPRNLSIGDVYETTPAVTESRVVMDADGNPTTEIEEVIVTPAIDKKVTPAGVDQGKITSVLLAKIEQLERRLTAAGL